MWNSEFKDQLCPWGQTTRAGKQEATGAAGPGIKGSSRGGRGGYRLAGPQSRGQPHRPVSSVGIVCLPLSIVPSQRVRGRKEEKHRGCQGRLGLLHSRGILPCWPLAFQGDYLTPTLPQLHKGSRGFSHQGCPISLSPPPRSRPSQTSQTGKQREPCAWRLPEEREEGTQWPPDFQTSNISKHTLETNTELPTFHFVILRTATPNLTHTLPSTVTNHNLFQTDFFSSLY